MEPPLTDAEFPAIASQNPINGTEQRQTVRQQQIRPILDTLHEWMTLQRMRPVIPS